MRYEQYKDSGIEWLGEVPAHWKVERAKNYVDLITGFPFKSEQYSETGIKLARGINVKEGVFHWGDTKFWNQLSPVLKPYYLRANDVLVGMDGSKVGKNFCMVKEADLPVLLLQRVARLRTRKSLNPSLLYYLIGNTAFQYWVAISKTDPMVPHIAPKDLYNYPIPVGDIAEQAAIANFLEKKTAAIDKKLSLLETKIARYGELAKTIINEAVCRGLDKAAPLKDSGVEWIAKIPAHWDVKRLKDVVAINPSTSSQANAISSVDFLPMSNVNESTGEIYRYEDEPYDRVRQGYTAFKNGDVLFAKITPCMENGNCVIAEGLRNNIGFGSTEFVVFREKKLTNRFLHHFLRNEHFLKKAEQFMIGTAGQKRISTQYLQIHPVAIPPKEEQTTIAAYLDHKTETITRITANLKSQIAALKELRKTLINNVVTGKRKVVS